jgi:predicted kinase
VHVDAHRPTIYLLCGFVGAGKTTYARTLESQGIVRLSIDELVFERRGRHGVDYLEDRYPQFEAEAVAELDAALAEHVRAGRSVVLDYGFWSKNERDRYKRLADTLGADWQLLYFHATDDVLRARLQRRNARRDANALTVTERHFEEFMSRFHPPDDEGEHVIPEAY